MATADQGRCARMDTDRAALDLIHPRSSASISPHRRLHSSAFIRPHLRLHSSAFIRVHPSSSAVAFICSHLRLPSSAVAINTERTPTKSGCAEGSSGIKWRWSLRLFGFRVLGGRVTFRMDSPSPYRPIARLRASKVLSESSRKVVALTVEPYCQTTSLAPWCTPQCRPSQH